MNLSHVRAECPSCVSVESRAECRQLVSRCVASQTNMMFNLWVTAGSTSAGAVRPFEAHQPSSESNAAPGRPSAPTGTTHSDTDNPSALGRRQESPSHRAIAVPAEEHVHHGRCTSEFSEGQLRARKCGLRQHAQGGYKQSVGLEPGLNMRSWHSVQVYDVLCSQCYYLRGHTPK